MHYIDYGRFRRIIEQESEWEPQDPDIEQSLQVWTARCRCCGGLHDTIRLRQADPCVFVLSCAGCFVDYFAKKT